MIEFDCSDENIKRTLEKDYFQRNAYIDNLIRYISESDEQTTFALNGEWGSGKTVFLHQFMYLIKNKELMNDHGLTNISSDDYEVFYYNAWENELLKKPSIAILKSITDKYKLIDEKDKEMMKDVMSILLNVVLKIGSAGILNFDDFHNDTMDEIDTEKIRKTFNRIIDYILKSKRCKRVIIVVDELDRCKPTTVVQMLEEIKHFYNHNSLTFIFSADFTQLSHAINSLYGQEFNSGLYLQRFFDATFALNSSSYEKYINEELEYNISDNNIITEMCKVAISYCGLTIRETNKFIKKIRTISKNFYSSTMFEREIPIAQYVFIPWGLALKYKDNAQYDAFMSGFLKKEELEEFLSYSKEVPKWLTGCYLQNKDVPKDFSIVDKLYELYKLTFRIKEFSYYRDNINNQHHRKYIVPYIEF